MEGVKRDETFNIKTMADTVERTKARRAETSQATNF
jgi:hypothetical protein